MTVGMSRFSPTPCAAAKGDGRCSSSTGAATAIAKGLSEVTGTVPRLGVGGASPWQKESIAGSVQGCKTSHGGRDPDLTTRTAAVVVT